MEYTPTQIKNILKELNITPYKANRVDSQQAATILTWRLRQEHNIERTYTDIAVRRRVNTRSLAVAERINKRFNLYEAKDIFALSLVPERAEGAKYRTSHPSHNPSKEEPG